MGAIRHRYGAPLRAFRRPSSTSASFEAVMPRPPKRGSHRGIHPWRTPSRAFVLAVRKNTTAARPRRSSCRAGHPQFSSASLFRARSQRAQRQDHRDQRPWPARLVTGPRSRFWSANDKVDPVGAVRRPCAVRGSRTSSRELNNEKVDLSSSGRPNIRELVVEALKPGPSLKTLEVDEAAHKVTVLR